MSSDIGGMDIQKQEIREAVELPLTHFDLYKQIGMEILSLLKSRADIKSLVCFLSVLQFFPRCLNHPHRYWPTPWCPDARTPWLWKDYVS